MHIEIGQFEYTECWDGMLYKKLSSYPNITDWQIQNILDFIKYESDNGRNSDIKAQASIIKAIDEFKEKHRSEDRLSPPEKITECTACPKYEGCHSIVVPAEYRDNIEAHIPDGLSERVHFEKRNGADIWKWSEIVYEYARGQ